jgi:hypothetical protein
LHRVGSSKRPAPPDQLARLFQQRSQSRLIAGRMPEYRLIGESELLLTIYAANPEDSRE